MKMNNKENDIIYNANDIQEYLSGKLTPLQMHAMEKAALDDPFLAEAIEGYEGLQHDDWKDQLAALKNEFAGEKNQAKVVAMHQRKNNWWKVAAAVLLIGGTATIAYKLTGKKEQKDIAQAVEPKAKTAGADTTKNDIAKAETTLTTTNSQLSTLNNAESDKSNITSGNASTGSAIETFKLADSTFVYTPPKKQEVKADRKQNENVAPDDEVKDKNNTAANVHPPASENNAAVLPNKKIAEENKYYNSNGRVNANGNSNVIQFQKAKTTADKDFFAADLKKETQLNHNFRAQVVGPDNSPLPFANISIKSENFGTYADAKGNFRLISADSLLTVEVKAAGYQPQFYTLQSFVQQNKIVLAEEDAASRYKTISGNSTTAKAKTSRRATLLKDSLVNVEPADGWDNYNTYVDNNIEIPDDILKKDIHGQVELSFDVSANGTISNIRVDKSLCDNCDELAKRLIEQGPQWKVKKGKKGKGKITVQF